MLTVPVRGVLDAFAATANVADPGPPPVVQPVTVIQGALLVGAHAHPLAEVTPIDAVAAAAGNNRLALDSVYEHGTTTGSVVAVAAADRPDSLVAPSNAATAYVNRVLVATPVSLYVVPGVVADAAP